MAEPHDPGDLDPADDVPTRGDPGWVRPSQRRAQRSPAPETPPTPPADETRAAGDEPDASAAAAPAPRQSRRRPRTPAAAPTRAPDADTTEVEPDGPLAASDDDPDPADADATVAAGTAAAAASAAETRAARRASRSKRRTRRRAAAAAGALVIVVALVAGLVLTSGGSTTVAVRKRHLVAVTTTTAAPHSTTAITATSKVLVLQAFDQPSATGKVVTTLSAKTDYGLPRTLLVTAVQSGWLQVFLPMKPNDTQGWIRQTDVTTSTTDYALTVKLSEHHLWLTKAGAPVLDTPVVIGTPKTPTPTGVFYVTDPVDLRSQPNGAYGAFALGLSGYSNVLPSFDGGPPQIAVHGTPYPDQVGQDLSNGCVRIPSPVIVQIAGVVPLGTPVTITA